MTDFGGKTSIFSHPVYLFLRKFSLQDSRGGSERQRLKELERENRELRRSNDILRQASAYFAKAEFDRLWKK
ncbi:putative transposase [Escherichia coli 5-366-08_S4_C1]|nr:putative transposase [Escherichia coli 5-366-08_S4_C1]